MRYSTRVVSKAFIDPLVVVTMMTTAGLITGVLAYAIPFPTYLTIGFCIFIGILGSLTVFYQVQRLYHRDMARKALSAYVAEGKQLAQLISHASGLEHEGKIKAWGERVKSELAASLGRIARSEISD